MDLQVIPAQYNETLVAIAHRCPLSPLPHPLDKMEVLCQRALEWPPWLEHAVIFTISFYCTFTFTFSIFLKYLCTCIQSSISFLHHQIKKEAATYFYINFNAFKKVIKYVEFSEVEGIMFCLNCNPKVADAPPLFLLFLFFFLPSPRLSPSPEGVLQTGVGA